MKVSNVDCFQREALFTFTNELDGYFQLNGVHCASDNMRRVLETHRYLGKNCMEHIRLLATAASATGKEKYGAFVANVHREMCVALCKGNHALFRAGVQLYTPVAGKARVDGLLHPTAEIGC